MGTSPDLAVGDGDALVIIDMQNDFCAGGALIVPNADEIIPRLNQLAVRFQNVILTQDWHPPGHISFASSHPGRRPFETIEAPYGDQELWPDHCVQATRGADLHPGLDVPHAELILRKGFRKNVDSYSAFFENNHLTPTGLSGYLRERAVERIFICGLAFDLCVRFSAEDAKHCGFQPVIVEDLCRAIGDDTLAVARTSINSLGIRCIESDLLIP